MKFIISNNPANLEAELSQYVRTGTVEAEYGDVVVRGSRATLAHHGPRSGNPAPCLADNMAQIEGMVPEIIGLSHVDLDAIGGCMALGRCKPEADSFWELAAFMDTNGLHKLAQAGASEEDARRLYAWRSWEEGHRVYPPRDGSVADVTKEVLEAFGAIEMILGGNEEYLRAGDAFRAAERQLNESSLIMTTGPVMVRTSAKFINHLYTDPTGKSVYLGVVGLDAKTGEITISLAEPIPGVNCRDLAVEIWGDKAGGHPEIAGSPRSGGFTVEDAIRVAEVFAARITAAIAT